MGIISTSFKITKTIRNINRLREIVTVFAKHGFDEFISQGVLTNIPNFVLPKSTKGKIKEELDRREEGSWPEVIGYRLRLCFEELGPAFVKFGQLFSSREDIFPQGFIEQMKLLRDKVKPLNFSEVKPYVEKSLGTEVEKVFKTISEKPIGTASIGLVYEAELLTGEKVVLKVKRPNIEKVIETDLSILIFMANQSERAGDEIKYLGLSKIMEDFSVSLQSELDFHIEGMNCERLKKIISKYDPDETFYLPKIYSKHSTSDVLVMELIEGIPFSNQDEIEKVKADLTDKLEFSIKTFLKTFLADGFFHADLHGGNFFYTPDKKIALIDFGLVGSLSRGGRQSFLAIIYSLITFNFENLVYEFLDVAEYEETPDIDKLIVDIKYAIGPYVGLTIQQTNFTIVLRSIVTTLREHEIFLPREWFIVFRSLITLDGVGKSLGIDFDIFSIVEEDIHDLIKQNLKKEVLIEDAAWVAKDVLNSSRIIPRHMRWFFKSFAKNGYAFEVKHKNIEGSFEKLSTSIEFLGLAVIASVLFLAGFNFINSNDLIQNNFSSIPIVTYGLWIMSFGLAAWGLRRR